MSRPSLLALLALACLPRPASADLDAETKTPYQLRVVLHAEEHRALTPIFQRQLERELGDLLRHSFGPLVSVEVERWHPAEHPILREIERRGLHHALEGWDTPLKGKTHFLLLRFAADRYEIRSRQYDHLTGLCTGTERRAEVADRRSVARQAAELVEQDFGVVGTVVHMNGRKIDVAVKGGALGVSLKRWVGPGDVLSVVRVLKDKDRGEGMPWVLLRVTGEEGDGVYRCQLFNRFDADTLAREPGVLGYRCLRMSAKQLPLRLRLVDDKTGGPIDGVEVQVRRADFIDQGEVEKHVPRNGLVVSNEVYDRAAFVRVMVGDVQKAQVPVLLLDEQPVVCRLGAIADSQAESRARLGDRRDFWVRRILEALDVANERVRELNRQRSSDPENTLALARAKHKALTDDLTNLNLERDELRKADAKLDLGDGERLLGALKKRGDELQSYIEGLDRALKEAKGERAQKLKADYAKARLLETQAEYQQALDIYNAILKDNPQETNVRDDRNRLAKAWQLHGPAHEQARKFIYETWPKLDLVGLQAEMKKAGEALAACKKAGDRLTPRKMLQASVTHAANLKKRLETVQRLDSEEGRAEAKRLVQVGQEFRSLLNELTAFVGKE
jgi:tetratricopeptide (TPR) repeat protein